MQYAFLSVFTPSPFSLSSSDPQKFVLLYPKHTSANMFFIDLQLKISPVLPIMSMGVQGNPSIVSGTTAVHFDGFRL
jgi:hypothetical protein